MNGERESESAEADVLRDILEEADVPITYAEMEKRWEERLQVAIRGLNFTGDLQMEDGKVERIERKFSIADSEKDDR